MLVPVAKATVLRAVSMNCCVVAPIRRFPVSTDALIRVVNRVHSDNRGSSKVIARVVRFLAMCNATLKGLFSNV